MNATATLPAPSRLPPAPAQFLGMQDGGGIVPDFGLYNLTAAVPGHPAGSTVSEMTLRRLGYAVPAGERECEPTLRHP